VFLVLKSLGLICAIWFASAAFAQNRYQITRISTAQGVNIAALGINNKGGVVGYSFHCFVLWAAVGYRQGALTMPAKSPATPGLAILREHFRLATVSVQASPVSSVFPSVLSANRQAAATRSFLATRKKFRDCCRSERRGGYYDVH
jgi:hypothetical protein